MSAEQTHPVAAPILGILKDVEDPGSGAIASYHVVVAYQVMLINSTAVVTFASYVSRAMHEAGKSPLAHVTLQLKEAPRGDSANWPTWFAERVLADEVNLLSGQTVQALSGAVAVRAEEFAA